MGCAFVLQLPLCYKSCVFCDIIKWQKVIPLTLDLKQLPPLPQSALNDTLDSELDDFYLSGLFDIEASPAFKALDLLKDQEIQEDRFWSITQD
jgi:hypothetical protein